ncbi:hypothetical protein [Phenylobacterium sp. 58.2.17]|uniref:hypothetical protein n=1 Tax=Phenylobacterium sp. 58.2.17 TaxID=2969306 RepID=UPI002264D852|nr:hypothetical protein [Phenylobacterium sp. 58.2.17]MCX7585004.1 hypothetical protein [Phenylobacterium sp. 58.2.17]
MPTAPLPIPNITTPVPLSTDPDNFDARADLAWQELPEAIDAQNVENAKSYANALEVFEKAAEISAAAAVAIDGAGAVGRSNSSLVVGAGTKPVTLQSAKPNLVVLNKRVVLVQISDPSIRMFGTISAVTSTTVFAVTVVSSGAYGSGTYSAWMVIDAAFYAAAATPADILAATSDSVSVSPKGLKGALAPFALTDGATVTPDGLNGLDFTWTIGGNRLLGAIVNTYPGARGRITITQDGTGSRVLAVASAYKREGGLAVLTTAAGAKDYLLYDVVSVDGGGTATEIIYDLIRSPTT